VSCSAQEPGQQAIANEVHKKLTEKGTWFQSRDNVVLHFDACKSMPVPPALYILTKRSMGNRLQKGHKAIRSMSSCDLRSVLLTNLRGSPGCPGNSGPSYQPANGHPVPSSGLPEWSYPTTIHVKRKLIRNCLAAGPHACGLATQGLSSPFSCRRRDTLCKRPRANHEPAALPLCSLAHQSR